MEVVAEHPPLSWSDLAGSGINAPVRGFLVHVTWLCGGVVGVIGVGCLASFGGVLGSDDLS